MIDINMNIQYVLCERRSNAHYYITLLLKLYEKITISPINYIHWIYKNINVLANHLRMQTN